MEFHFPTEVTPAVQGIPEPTMVEIVKGVPLGNCIDWAQNAHAEEIANFAQEACTSGLVTHPSPGVTGLETFLPVVPEDVESILRSIGYENGVGTVHDAMFAALNDALSVPVEHISLFVCLVHYLSNYVIKTLEVEAERKQKSKDMLRKLLDNPDFDPELKETVEIAAFGLAPNDDAFDDLVEMELDAQPAQDAQQDATPNADPQPAQDAQQDATPNVDPQPAQQDAQQDATPNVDPQPAQQDAAPAVNAENNAPNAPNAPTPTTAYRGKTVDLTPIGAERKEVRRSKRGNKGVPGKKHELTDMTPGQQAEWETRKRARVNVAPVTEVI